MRTSLRSVIFWNPSTGASFWYVSPLYRSPEDGLTSNVLQFEGGTVPEPEFHMH